MSISKPKIAYARRYVNRFPSNVYSAEILKSLNIDVDTTNTKTASKLHGKGRIATPHFLSYRIPKHQTTCTETMLRRMKRLNDDTTRQADGHLRKRDRDREFMSDLGQLEKNTRQMIEDVEAFWDSALQNGQVSENQWLRYQFRQFKKVPSFQNHPQQILIEVRRLKQSLFQRLYGVNSREIHQGGHDAALVLVTPGLANLIGQKAFEETILELWPVDARNWDQYHLVMAVVDGTHFPDEDSSSATEGISVIRGSKSVMFPNLWEKTEPRETEVKDDVGALTFDIGGVSSVTVPLANTLFQNGKMSTLRATKVQRGKPTETKDIFEQHIRLPSMHKRGVTFRHRTITNVRLPLEPVTDMRVATESFGNILRRVQVDKEEKPASFELEKAITGLQSRIAQRAAELGIEFPGVWAVVFQKEKGHLPMWNVESQSAHDTGSGMAMSTIPNVLHMDKPSFKPNPFTGRPFKLLSGGGGWGAKAGLLALDPQISHFAKSEKQMQESLFGDHSGSTYIPKGAAVQFFISDERRPTDLRQTRDYVRRGGSRLLDFPVDDGGAFLDRGEVWEKKSESREFEAPEKKLYFGEDGVPRLMFGVGSRLPPGKDHDTVMALHVGEFGVVSNKAIYLDKPQTSMLTEHPGAQYAPKLKPMKFDMPGAQVQLAHW